MRKKYEITLHTTIERGIKPVRYKFIKEGDYDSIIKSFKESRFYTLTLKSNQKATLVNLDYVSEIDIIEIE